VIVVVMDVDIVHLYHDILKEILNCKIFIEKSNLKIKNMADLKSWLQSRTIWSVLVSVAPFLSKLVGFDIDATLADVLTIAGAVGAIYFRVTASTKLK